MRSDLIGAGSDLTRQVGLGAPLANGYELASNVEMGKRAQRRATVKPLQPGIIGGAARKGRRARSR